MSTVTLILTSLLVALAATLHFAGFKGRSLTPLGQRVQRLLPLSQNTSSLLFLTSTLATLFCLLLTMAEGPSPRQLIGLGLGLLIQALARISLYATTFGRPT